MLTDLYNVNVKTPDRRSPRPSSDVTAAVAKAIVAKVLWYSQRRLYRRLRRRKCTEFWRDNRPSPRPRGSARRKTASSLILRGHF